MINAPLQISSAERKQSASTPLLLQRECACGSNAQGLTGECEECGQKRMLGLQTKLAVNEPGDKYEQEADRIADTVMRMPASSMPLFSAAQIGQQDDFDRRGAFTNAEAEGLIDQLRHERGQPLDPTTRSFMETRMGHDFGRVRIHANETADRAAQAVEARAFTLGREIAFSRGAYHPHTPQGMRLLVHELTHVVQQSQSNSVTRSRRPEHGASPDFLSSDQDLVQRQGRALTGEERRERRRERRRLRRGERKAQRARERAIRQGKPSEAVATLRLLTFTETLNPNFLTLRNLRNAQVGHTWLELSYDDPEEVPEDIGPPTRDLLSGDGTAFGFWPLVNRTAGLDPDSAEYASVLGDAPERQSRGFTPGRGLTEEQLGGFSTEVFASFVPGRVEEPDDSHKGDETATQEFWLSEAEASSLMRYVNSKRSAPYSLFKYNCTTFAIEAVQAAGHSAPSASVLGVKLPNALRRELFTQEKEAGLLGDPTITVDPPITLQELDSKVYGP